jgi:hypothetical protein
MAHEHTDTIVSGSFRDPSGFLFYRDGTLYRQVNISYRHHYTALIDSGLYRTLVDKKLLIAHTETTVEPHQPDSAFMVIAPEKIPFISYPWEWCFSQLKDAALTTLTIQKIALEHSMSLKDSSAFNIQFLRGKPVFIDTLSFEPYREGTPWVAYRQFCRHFVAPLSLMAYRDIRLQQMLRVHIDGIPLDLASHLLPLRTWFRLSLLSHIHIHARSEQHYADKRLRVRGKKMSRLAFMGLIDNLHSLIRSLRYAPRRTQWGEYYDDTNYSHAAFEHKKSIVSAYIDKITPHTVWDIGANTGIFSRLASAKSIQTVAFDQDPLAVEQHYRSIHNDNDRHSLPLLLDITNPSAPTGWINQEREGIFDRCTADMVLALALIHHLAIANNVPFDRIVDLFSRLCKFLVIEFVPKEDSQVQRLLQNREDIFSSYTQEAFERSFSVSFSIMEQKDITESSRILYLMKKRD